MKLKSDCKWLIAHRYIPKCIWFGSPPCWKRECQTFNAKTIETPGDAIMKLFDGIERRSPDDTDR